MIILPGAKGIFRKVGMPEIPLTFTPTVWYRPEYIYDGLGNLITTINTPVEYWQPYNNSASNIFNIFVDGGGGGGTTAPIKQDPTTNYGGLYLGSGTLSNNIQQLNTQIEGNPIEFIGGATTVGPIYKKNVPCMNNRPAVYFDGTGGYLKVNTNLTANYASTVMKNFLFSFSLCLTTYPVIEQPLITIGSTTDNIYYTVCIDATNLYIKSNTGSQTIVANYSLDTAYRISFWKQYAQPPSTNTTVNRVAFMSGDVLTLSATLATTPTNFPQGRVFTYQLKLLNTFPYHLGDFIFYNNYVSTSVINSLGSQSNTYMNTKYAATN